MMDSENEDDINRINCKLRKFELFVNEHAAHISPQLTKRILQTTSCQLSNPNDVRDILHGLKTLFSRLLVELVQAQCNTKQREQDLIRLIDGLGCSIREPQLTDQVIELLTKLYKAAGQSSDTSFERNVLVKFLLKELSNLGYRKRQVEKVIQTLYKCGCFNIIKQDGASSRLSLKGELGDPVELRHRHDVEIICLGQSNSIRLSPKSWAFLLHGRSSPDNVAHVQSILDKHQSRVTVEELRICLQKTGDRFGIRQYLSDLLQSESYLYSGNLQGNNEDFKNISNILENLAKIEHLFMVRQCRGRMSI